MSKGAVTREIHDAVDKMYIVNTKGVAAHIAQTLPVRPKAGLLIIE